MMRMMRLVFGRSIRSAMGVALCASALVGASSSIGYAGQSTSLTEGVYSAEQSARGQLIYQAQCGECHGSAMEGSIGPPLAGDGFLANWSARPLSELVDKTQRTMPFQLPGTLSREESTDVTAYILQVGAFPVGDSELNDAMLAEIRFPTTATPALTATGSDPSLLPPEGNLAELMRAIQFPNSNIIFNVQLGDPETRPKKEPPTFDYVEWGSTIYTGWLAVDQAAVALIETAPLLLMPGRRCQNGRPVPLDREDWKPYVDAMVEAATLARQASQARDYAAFGDISERLNTTCADCHMAYRDGEGAEGSGAARCQ